MVMSHISNFLTYLFMDVLLNILRGMKDSIYGIYSINVHYTKPKKSSEVKTLQPKKSKFRDYSIKKELELELDVRASIYKCCGCNGLTYGSSIFGFYFMILPFVKFFLDIMLAQYISDYIWTIVKPALTILFEFGWTIPMFFICKFINTFWFQDIANCAYRQRHGRPEAFSISGIGSQISDSVFSFVIEILFLIQSTSMQYVPYPYASLVLSCVHFSLLNSLYSFEYMWCNKGWTFHRRISYIESNWAYFLGFGMPLSLVTFFLPSVFESGFMYATFFPWFIISAIEAPPIREESTGPPLKLFSVVVWLSSMVTRKVFSKKWTSRSRIR